MIRNWLLAIATLMASPLYAADAAAYKEMTKTLQGSVVLYTNMHPTNSGHKLSENDDIVYARFTAKTPAAKTPVHSWYLTAPGAEPIPVAATNVGLDEENGYWVVLDLPPNDSEQTFEIMVTNARGFIGWSEYPAGELLN